MRELTIHKAGWFLVQTIGQIDVYGYKSQFNTRPKYQLRYHVRGRDLSPAVLGRAMASFEMMKTFYPSKRKAIAAAVAKNMELGSA